MYPTDRPPWTQPPTKTGWPRLPISQSKIPPNFHPRRMNGRIQLMYMWCMSHNTF